MTRRAFISDCLVDAPVEGAQVVARQWYDALPPGSPVVQRRAGGGGVGLLVPPRVLHRLRREQVDVVDVLLHSGLTYALVLDALLLHLLTGAHVRLLVLQRHRSLGPWVVRLLRGSTSLVVANDADRAYVEAAGLPVTQLTPIADPDRVSGLSREEARRRLGLPLHERIFLHVGHGTPGRNLGALAPLAGHGLLVLVLSPYSPLDPRAVPSGDRVRVVHERVDVATWYRAADVYVFPTTDAHASIGVPMSVVEALAGGLPVVARRSALTTRWGTTPGVTLVEDDEALVAACT